ncbi:MAG TPA: beta-L-arabinofuranosidase domain-containing protein, partial [Povalibacter sp.]|nr:beta-L-arabinofuranosidase domain-containing protein [Povalibacter sp.]
QSRLKMQLDQQQSLFMGLDNDRLLKPFRQRAGQDAPGADMGGWYDDSRDFHIDPTDWSTANWHGYIPGHSFGQYVSGLARAYAISGDPAIKVKVRNLVVKYIPTISPKFFDGYYLPAYTYDKLVIGLIDAWQHAGISEASSALNRLTDVVLPYLPEKALTREERRQRPYTTEAQIWDEPYTLPENLFKAWKLGMGERYRSLAIRYLQDDALFNPLAAGISPLKGKHAYSHVNALNSAVEAYLATGDRKYLRAAVNGFGFIERQSYATGGWGPNEELVAADDSETLLEMLTATHRTFETPCGAYGHFKIARSLLKITRDSRYGDSMERVLYNTILGALPTTADGETFYYSDYNDKATKFFRGEKWPCCSGTFIQLAADYGISTCLTDGRGIYVNLYVPSTVRAHLAGGTVVVNQKTDYPLTNVSRIEVSAESRSRFSVFLRIPLWAGAHTRVRINDETLRVQIQPGSFLEVARTWNQGDAVEIDFDMPLRLEPLNAAHPDMVAVMTGPLVLFPIEAASRQLRREEWLSAARRAPDMWIASSAAGDIAMKPFMSIAGETYRLYNKVSA